VRKAADAAGASAVADQAAKTVAPDGVDGAQAIDRTPPSSPSWTSTLNDAGRGYLTGTLNLGLGMADGVNSVVNLGLAAVGSKFRFRTDMEIAPQNSTEAAAQRGIGLAAAATGVAGLARGIAMEAPATVSALRGALGVDAMATEGVGAAKLGDLSAQEISKIQSVVDSTNQNLYVVGSAARAERRNVGTNLPIKGFDNELPLSETRSDIDYASKLGHDDLLSQQPLPDMDPAFGVRGLDYLNLDSGPAIRFSPGQPPTFLPAGGGRIPLG
jgi:hypothetical protein